MKLKEWVKKTEKKMKENDHMYIMYKRKFGKLEQIRMIYKSDLKKYPLLLEADVVKEEEEESEYMSFNMSFQCTGQGKCMNYSCWIDNDQAMIGLNIKSK